MKKVIFLDAVGTIFDVKGSVGNIYAYVASNYNIYVSSEELNRSFRNAWRRSPEATFDADLSQNKLRELERLWWKNIVAETFRPLMDLNDFPDFESFFSEVFDYFATSEAWHVFPEVELALQDWLSSGFELGVISNFDSRLTHVLSALGLSDYFSSVTISTQVNAAKPNPRIFHHALAQYGYLLSQGVHIGDQYVDDFQGAEGAGLKALWLIRGDDAEQVAREQGLLPGQYITHLDIALVNKAVNF